MCTNIFKCLCGCAANITRFQIVPHFPNAITALYSGSLAVGTGSRSGVLVHILCECDPSRGCSSYRKGSTIPGRILLLCSQSWGLGAGALSKNWPLNSNYEQSSTQIKFLWVWGYDAAAQLPGDLTWLIKGIDWLRSDSPALKGLPAT